jgi:UPF0755 protein
MQTTPDQGPSVRTKLLLIGAAAVLGVVALVVLANVFAGLVSSPSTAATVEPGAPVTVVVAPGSAASTIYQSLADAGVVSYSEIEGVASEADVEDKLQAGTFDLETGMSGADVLRILLEGGTSGDARTITIIEGWTVAKIAMELAARTEHTEQDFVSALVTGSVSSPYLPDPAEDVTDLQRWEGLFYPAKYQIPEGTSATVILQNMSDEMVRRFETVDWSTVDDLGISRYEALVIGSIIEREAGTEDDRRVISSVVHNRLGVPMRLQIDSTVIYALGSNPGRVLAEHLETSSPYNTYRVDGLPPTPIGTVSEPSLVAAVHPVDSDYLFYVLKSADGSHAFAVTYEEHQENVRAAKAAGVLP